MNKSTFCEYQSRSKLNISARVVLVPVHRHHSHFESVGRVQLSVLNSDGGDSPLFTFGSLTKFACM